MKTTNKELKMFKLLSLFTKKEPMKSGKELLDEIHTAADIKKLDSEIDKTNVKIRKLYATSKLAIMNDDMNTVRIAAKVRNNLLNRIEDLHRQRAKNQA